MSAIQQLQASMKPASGGGSVAFDAASTSSYTGGTSFSWSHTCTGSDRCLIVGISSGGAGGGAATITGVTYNGVSMTSIGSVSVGAARVWQYQLIAPATGANTIAVTLNGGVNAEWNAGGVSFTNVNQTTAVGTPATANGTDATPTVNVSSAATEIVIDTISWSLASWDLGTVGAGQTQRWNSNVGGGDTFGAGSTETGAATTTMSWTLDAAADNWVSIAVAVKPV